MFRAALRRHRCILPASGFYEWQTQPGPTAARPRKRPWFVYPPAGGVFSLAGLFEPGEAGQPASCCIVTTDANAAMAPIHDRMPAILDNAALRHWLDPATDAAQAAALLRPGPPDWLALHPVGATALLAAGPVAAPIFGLLHGAGNGLMTIAKGTLPLSIFGHQGYGRRQGLLAAPARVSQALAPWLFGLVLASWNQWALVLTMGLGSAAMLVLVLTRGASLSKSTPGAPQSAAGAPR